MYWISESSKVFLTAPFYMEAEYCLGYTVKKATEKARQAEPYLFYRRTISRGRLKN